MSRKPLTDMALRRLPPGLHSDGGSPNLYLLVSESGARSWVFRFSRRIDGKTVRRTMGLGALHSVGLKEARERAAEMRNQLASGIDPHVKRREVIHAVPTFSEMARAFIEKESPTWRNQKHRAQWEATLATYVSPYLGDMRVDAIGVSDIRDVLMTDGLWIEKTETAKRLRGRIELIMGYASVLGHREGGNPAVWETLKHVLPAPRKVQVRRLMPALPYQRVTAFLEAIKAKDGVSARALEFVILTASRSGPARLADWSEVDLSSRVWICPADHMKGNREHRVPLSDAAIELLQGLGSREGLLFPGRSGPLSDMSLTKIIRTLPGEWVDPKQENATIVVHGFRSTFRDWASEVGQFPHDVIESALAHVIGNKTVAAYDRSDRFEARRKMMEAWGRYCLSLP